MGGTKSLGWAADAATATTAGTACGPLAGTASGEGPVDSAGVRLTTQNIWSGSADPGSEEMARANQHVRELQRGLTVDAATARRLS